MALDERDFFNNKNETRNDKLTCPRCKRVNEYQMRWVVRTRKDRIPPGADERDRALFAKLRDYMIRVDDSVTCKSCGKKFDIPSQHSMVFLQKGDEVRAVSRRTAPSATGRGCRTGRTRLRRSGRETAPRVEWLLRDRERSGRRIPGD